MKQDTKIYADKFNELVKRFDNGMAVNGWTTVE
jgi:hypothetical protein